MEKKLSYYLKMTASPLDNKFLFTVLLILAIGLWVCPCQYNEAEDAKELEDFKYGAIPASFADKQKQIGFLVKDLERDSRRGLEPFNSLAMDNLYTNAVGDALYDSLLTGQLISTIKLPQRRYFLSLLLLRKINAGAYATVGDDLKSGVYADALRYAHYFNTWGIPYLYWAETLAQQAHPSWFQSDTLRLEEAVQAMLELPDTTMIKQLLPILSEAREAPVWGSSEGLKPDVDPYQAKDYAAAIILKIQHGGIDFPGEKRYQFRESRAGRDSLIADSLLTLTL